MIKEKLIIKVEFFINKAQVAAQHRPHSKQIHPLCIQHTKASSWNELINPKWRLSQLYTATTQIVLNCLCFFYWRLCYLRIRMQGAILAGSLEQERSSCL
jgi:hypothetical protein